MLSLRGWMAAMLLIAGPAVAYAQPGVGGGPGGTTSVSLPFASGDVFQNPTWKTTTSGHQYQAQLGLVQTSTGLKLDLRVMGKQAGTGAPEQIHKGFSQRLTGCVFIPDSTSPVSISFMGAAEVAQISGQTYPAGKFYVQGQLYYQPDTLNPMNPPQLKWKGRGISEMVDSWYAQKAAQAPQPGTVVSDSGYDPCSEDPDDLPLSHIVE